MGYRTKASPNSKHTYLQRMLHALDITPYELCQELDVSMKEIAPILYSKMAPHEMDAFELWWNLHDMLSERIANLLAVQQELNRSLQADRARRVARIERVRNRPAL